MISGGKSDTLQDTEELLFVSRQEGDVTKYGGWQLELLVEEIVSVSDQKLLLCTLCKGLLRDACVVTLEGKKQPRCSVCVPLQMQTDALNIAGLIRSAIDDRMINCPFLSGGCEWSGPTSEIHLHFKECQYVHVPCPLGCLSNTIDLNVIRKFQRRYIQNHISQTCLMRLIPCEYCGNKVQASNIDSHFAICMDFPTKCMNKCTFQSLEGKVFVASRRIIRKHLESDCPLQKVICPYSKHGCKVQIVRKNNHEHKVEFMENHLHLIETAFDHIMSDLTSCKQKNIANENYINYLECKLNLPKKMTAIRMTIPCEKEGVRLYHRFHSSSAYYNGYRFAFYVEFDNKRNMGIYFYLMKGEMDDKLKWPLKCKICFYLMNQLHPHSELRKEIISSDYSGNKCFDKPISDEGDYGIGYPKFTSHSDIVSHGYCTEGSILLEVCLACFYFL